jgi:hypothetical protein
MVNKMKMIILLLTLSLAVGAQEYHYYDGGIRKTIKVSQEYEASVPQTSGTSTRGSNATSGGAVIMQNQRLQIMRKTTIGTSGTGTRSTTTTSTDATIPVFEQSGNLVSIPGGLIINFVNSASQASIDAWILARSLVVTRVIRLKLIKYYLIESPAGIASLNLSAQYQAESIVQEAKPNFWKDVRTRAMPDMNRKFDPKKR